MALKTEGILRKCCVILGETYQYSEELQGQPHGLPTMPMTCGLPWMSNKEEGVTGVINRVSVSTSPTNSEEVYKSAKK
jgi:hypothetical protein